MPWLVNSAMIRAWFSIENDSDLLHAINSNDNNNNKVHLYTLIDTLNILNDITAVSSSNTIYMY